MYTDLVGEILQEQNGSSLFSKHKGKVRTVEDLYPKDKKIHKTEIKIYKIGDSWPNGTAKIYYFWKSKFYFFSHWADICIFYK